MKTAEAVVEPPTTAKPAPTPAPDHEAVAKSRFFNSLKGHEDKPPAKPAATPVPDKPADEPKPAAAATPPTAQPEPKPDKKPVKVKAVEQPQMSAKEIATLAAETAAKVNRAPAAEPVVEELPPEVSSKAQVYAELETLNPTKYPKGLAKRVAESLKREQDYKAKWEKDNAGQKFDPEDDAHDDFYEKHEVPDELDIVRAETRLESRQETDKLRQQIDERDRRSKAEPEAQRVALMADEQVLKQFMPEITPQAIDKWKTENPVEHDVAVKHIMAARPVLQSASLIWDGVEQADARNPVHAEVFDATMHAEYESRLARAPKAELQDSEGRQWVPEDQFDAMTESDKAKYFTTTDEEIGHFKREFAKLPDADKAKFFITDKVSVLKHISGRAARLAKQEANALIQRSIEIATRLGYAKPMAPAPTPDPTPQNGHTPPAPTPPPAPASPSVGMSAPISAPGTAPRGDSSGPTSFVGSFIRRIKEG